MKKFILFLILLLISSLCYIFVMKPSKVTDNQETQIIKKEEVQKPKEQVIDIGLYKNYHNKEDRKLITEWTSNWKYHNDISAFEVFYTNKEYISGLNQINTFNEYKNLYENIDDYRIGYHLDFSLNDWHINKTILSPKDTLEFFDYLEVYLYDDYHRDGSWYSHTEEKDFNDSTLLTSIKLTAGKSVSAIESDIILTAFVYKKDDLQNNEYVGNNKYSITIKKSNKLN